MSIIRKMIDLKTVVGNSVESMTIIQSTGGRNLSTEQLRMAFSNHYLMLKDMYSNISNYYSNKSSEKIEKKLKVLQETVEDMKDDKRYDEMYENRFGLETKRFIDLSLMLKNYLPWYLKLIYIVV